MCVYIAYGITMCIQATVCQTVCVIIAYGLSRPTHGYMSTLFVVIRCPCVETLQYCCCVLLFVLTLPTFLYELMVKGMLFVVVPPS